MHGQSGIVRLDDRVAYFWRRHNAKRVHNTIGIFFSNFRDQQSAHATASAAAQRMRQLKALQAIARFSFLAYDVKHRVNKLGALCVVALGPVVARARLSKHKVVWSKYLTKRTRSNRVHGARLQVDQHCSWHVFTARGFIEVDVDSFQLQVRVTVVSASGIDTMLVRNDFPKFGSNLVTALINEEKI